MIFSVQTRKPKRFYGSCVKNILTGAKKQTRSICLIIDTFILNQQAGFCHTFHFALLGKEK